MIVCNKEQLEKMMIAKAKSNLMRYFEEYILDESFGLGDYVNMKIKEIHPNLYLNECGIIKFKQ